MISKRVHAIKNNLFSFYNLLILCNIKKNLILWKKFKGRPIISGETFSAIKNVKQPCPFISALEYSL